ncbi:hypothetical protein EYR40_002217 [Pleurotus pulmonarius]|nr:hypothetical protein EYR36_002290 [Pleurotus pulmonarius]KAF4583726.1 hypothetical protein EYR40_002217 [Pleurotus pulmonarius]
MVETIPLDPSAYKEWLDKMRAIYDRLLRRAGKIEEESDEDDEEWHYRDFTADDVDVEEVEIKDTRVLPDTMTVYVYEIDLDDEVFWVNGMPLFRLDCMPTAEVFLEVLSKDHYGHFATKVSMPSEHAYRIAAPAQPPSEQDLSSYESLQGSTNVGTDIHELLGVAKQPSPADRVRIRLYEIIAGLSMSSFQFVSRLLASQIAPSAPSTIPPFITATAKFMVFRAFLPMAFHPDIALSSEKWIEELERGRRGEGERMLWLRPDVCFSAGFYLEHDEHLRAAVGRMVREIHRASKNKKNGVVYGIICSLFHCVIVRVQLDSGSGGSFQHTPALQFLPFRFAESPSTPGITALLRLASKYDDLLSETVLSKSPFKSKPGASQVPASTYIDRLPAKPVARIAAFIPNLMTLLAFASLNPTTAAQANHELSFPFIGDHHLLQASDPDNGDRALARGKFVAMDARGRTRTVRVQGMGPDDTMYDTKQRFGSECYSVFTYTPNPRRAAFVLQAEPSLY